MRAYDSKHSGNSYNLVENNNSIKKGAKEPNRYFFNKDTGIGNSYMKTWPKSRTTRE
jgi:hypothetical protein